MKESSFVKENQKKWNELERIVDRTNPDPDRMSELFVEVTDDLAFSRTFYKNRSVRVYLNYVSQQIFSKIYKNRKSNIKKAFRFWTNTVPLEIWYARKSMITAALIFGLALFIGVVSSADDIEFSRVILGDQYVEMTEENINKSDPMAVYKGSEETSMFLRITFNNVRVAITCFIAGIMFGFGTFYFLMYNGIMVGAFQHFFYAKGVFLTSVLTIWIHGTIEITSIVIAGGAGFELSKGLMFPRTYTRLQSLRISGMRGMKIMLGLIPLFIIAGFFEGFITRHTEWPVPVKVAIIGGSALLMVLYFVILPIMKGRKLSDEKEIKEDLIFQPEYQFNLNIWKSVGVIFNDSIAFMREYYKKSTWMIVMSVIATIFLVYFNIDQGVYEAKAIDDVRGLNEWGQIFALIFGSPIRFAMNLADSFAWINFKPVVFVILTLLTTKLLAVAAFLLNRIGNKMKPELDRVEYQYFLKKHGYKSLIVCLILNLMMSVFIWQLILLVLIILPAFMNYLVWWITGLDDELNNEAFNLSFKEFFKSIGLMLATMFIWFLIVSVPNALSTIFLEEFIEWNIITIVDSYKEILLGFSSGVSILMFLISFPFIMVAYFFNFYSNREKFKAISLNERMENFGKRSNRVSEI